MKKLLTKDQEIIIVDYYNLTKNRVETCLKFNLKNSTFYSTLKRNKVKPDSNHQQNYSYNLEAFSDFEKDNKAAYFYGLLLSDGCILDNGTVQLALKSTDKIILEELKRYIGSSLPLVYRITTEGYESFSLHFRNRLLNNNLIPQGFIPRKSGNEKLPVFNWLDSPDFFRGLIDGDGAISISTSGSSTVKLHSSYEVVNGFISFVNKHIGTGKTKIPKLSRKFETGSLYNVAFHGITAVKILSILYYTGCLTIPRKLESAKAAINNTRIKGK